MMFLKNAAFLIAASLLLVITSFNGIAQVKEGQVLDKIVAVVGNEVIMLSELDGQLAAIAQQDKSFDVSDTANRNRILNAMIDQKLVITKAIQDSITVSDDEIEQRWEFMLSRFIQVYGSRKRIEDIYGMSIARLEYEYRDEIRKQILAQKIKEEKFKDVSATPEDVTKFFDEYKDSIPKIQTEVEVYHIVREVEANPKAKEDIYKLAESVRDSIVKGGNFADYAKRYSGDPGTATAGGELGWTEKGKLFPEFEKAAFALEVGEISKPVETPFGFHIIQLEGKNKDSVETRHILFRLGQSQTDIDKCKEFLMKMKDSCLAGGDFEKLAKIYSDEKETQGYGGLLGKFPLAQIPPTIKDVVTKLKDGEISEPLPYGSQPKTSFHIIYRKKTTPEHTANLKDDYQDLEQMAMTYKQNKLYQDWVESLRKSIYWEIKK